MEYVLYEKHIQTIRNQYQEVAELLDLGRVSLKTWHGDAPCAMMSWSDEDGISRNVNVLVVDPSQKGAIFRAEVNAWIDDGSTRRWVNVQMGDRSYTVGSDFKEFLTEMVERVRALGRDDLINESTLR